MKLVTTNKWNKANTKPPFTTTMDGNKYSNPMLCYDKFGNYCIAQYVRWQTGYCGWYDHEEEVSITHWSELQEQYMKRYALYCCDASNHKMFITKERGVTLWQNI